MRITGTTNHHTSNMRNHALSEQHEAAMSLLKTAEAKSSNQPLESYCRIALMFMTEEFQKQVQEVIFVAHCKLNDMAKEIQYQTRYLTILNPSSTTADGVIVSRVLWIV